MPFRPNHIPASFQDLINYIINNLIDKGVIVYIGNILIYAKNTEEYNKLLDEVEERFTKNDFVISPENCVQLKTREISRL
jgi:hypothetical protein